MATGNGEGQSKIDILIEQVGNLTEGLTELKLLIHEQAEAAKQQAEAAKQQAEAAKQQAEVAKQQADSIQQQTEIVKQQVESARLQADSINKLVALWGSKN